MQQQVLIGTLRMLDGLRSLLSVVCSIYALIGRSGLYGIVCGATTARRTFELHRASKKARPYRREPSKPV